MDSEKVKEIMKWDGMDVFSEPKVLVYERVQFVGELVKVKISQLISDHM